MNPKLPPEMIDFQERNRRYVQTLLDSVGLSPEERDRRRDALKLALTPHETIYEENTLRLYRFQAPSGKKPGGRPLLIVPSLILRWYILDLMPGHSLIEHLVEHGVDVWLIDWGRPGPEHGLLTIGDYVDTFIRRCVRQVSRHTACDRISLMGQCLGGTLAVTYASLHPVDRLICLTTPVDFQDAGLLSLWTSQETFNVDRVVEAFGPVVPPSFVHACFQFLDVKATVERYKRLYNNVLDEAFMTSYLALDHWLGDQVPFPAQMFKWLIHDLYQENRLSQGRLEVNGRVADPANIEVPLLNISAQYDHVFPEKSVTALHERVKGRADYHCMPTGHVTCVTVFPQRLETYRLITEFVS